CVADAAFSTLLSTNTAVTVHNFDGDAGSVPDAIGMLVREGGRLIPRFSEGRISPGSTDRCEVQSGLDVGGGVMALTSGTRLGPYEIVAPVGAGGMGEVYRARDIRLDRIVAIKVLPSSLSADPDFKLRFEREARALSSLNHPNICTLHDLGNQDGVDFLVMEYLEGETLSHRLQKSRLPFDQALKIGIEVADALVKAQRHGIVHRDLKPGNIMLTKAGAKLMDFGLAKPTPKRAVASGPATATISESLTAKGTIIGTLQYMAPEQLQGTEADARSDIFALGAVLYEMLTGRQAFAGKNPASIIAAILTMDPPPVTHLQRMSPPILEHAVNRALAKDPDERWQAAQDFAGELRWIREGGGQSSPSSSVARWRWRELIGWGMAAAAMIAALVSFRARSGMLPPPVRFQISAPEGVDHPFATVSPDGRRIAITDDDGGQIWIRDLSSVVAHPLPNTDGARGVVWSPDSRYLIFTSGGKLRKVLVPDGSPETVCDALSGYPFGSWSSRGTILFNVGE